MSSSSVIPGADPESSSSIALAKSSSSVFSSSSWTLSSSDSRETGTIESSSSSYSIELNCSALLEGESGWSRDVPKECRFNPDITYGTMTDTRDKKVYKTIKIGDQTWMAENLNYADSVTTKSLQNRSWCYNNVAANCAVAGRLYTWGAAIDSVKLATDADNPQDCGYGMTCTLPAKVQGICPEGWHLPTNAEWETLFTEVGGSSTAGKIFKSQTGWCNNGNGTDGVGFSALPVGYRHNKGWFYYDCNDAYFWSATELDAINAYRMDLTYHYEFAHLYYSLKNVGFSVRCLQD
jgi:uncharacterized protein (TIGR02145 family)